MRLKKITPFIFIMCFATIILFVDGNDDDFKETKSDMEFVANEIAAGKYEIDANGLVELPDEYKYLADTGTVCMVSYEGESAVYFWTYRGMLGSSKGYVYVLGETNVDITEKCSDEFDFTNIKAVSENWYKVSTED